MKISNRLVITAFILTPLRVSAMPGGEGIVLDSTSNLPIADATVSLECRVSEFHGSEKLKDLTAKSNKNGQFSFSHWDLFKCSFAYVTPSKSGYQATAVDDTRYANTDYGRVPPKIWLTQLGRVHQQKLELLKAMISGRFSSSLHEYAYVYQSFVTAKHISASLEDRIFVHDVYCARLMKLFASLSDEEKSSLPKYAMQGLRGEPATPSSDAHQKEVVTFCGGKF